MSSSDREKQKIHFQQIYKNTENSSKLMSARRKTIEPPNTLKQTQSCWDRERSDVKIIQLVLINSPWSREWLQLSWWAIKRGVEEEKEEEEEKKGAFSPAGHSLGNSDAGEVLAGVLENGEIKSSSKCCSHLCLYLISREVKSFTAYKAAKKVSRKLCADILLARLFQPNTVLTLRGVFKI